MRVSDLGDKKILIVGFGREGQDAFLFLRKQFPEKTIGIADKKEFEELPPDAQKLLNADLKVVLYFGDTYLKQIHAHDVILKSPGIPLRVINAQAKKKQTITSATNIFFSNCKGTIVGVTGTKGKSTTASLLAEVLKLTKQKVYLVGNIEQPALQHLSGIQEADIVVYELSSAQLETADQSPHIAVLLNFYPEHMDYHGTLSAYLRAKTNITKFQTPDDYFIFNEADETVAKVAASTKAKPIGFKPKNNKGAAFIAALEPVFAVAKLFNIPKDKMEKAIQKFKPLPHRLQRVGTHKGITFYNDSLATIPEATIAALDQLGPTVHTLLVGGFDRGISMEKLALRLLKSKIHCIIVFPTTGELVVKEMEKIAKKEGIPKLPQSFFVNNMATAVQLAYDHTPKGGICLLSPAASSFHMFQNYKERGEEFQKFVKFYATHEQKKAA